MLSLIVCDHERILSLIPAGHIESPHMVLSCDEENMMNQVNDSLNTVSISEPFLFGLQDG